LIPQAIYFANFDVIEEKCMNELKIRTNSLEGDSRKSFLGSEKKSVRLSFEIGYEFLHSFAVFWLVFWFSLVGRFFVKLLKQ
jgi:hypothetical protein